MALVWCDRCHYIGSLSIANTKLPRERGLETLISVCLGRGGAKSARTALDRLRQLRVRCGAAHLLRQDRGVPFGDCHTALALVRTIMRSTIALASVQTLTETRRRGRSASSPPARSSTCQWWGGASQHAPTTRLLSPSRDGCSARRRLGEHSDLPIVHVLSSSLIGFDSSPCIRNRTHLDHDSALHSDLEAGTPQIDLHLLAPRAARHRNIHLDMVQRLRPAVRKGGLLLLLALRRSLVMHALRLRRQRRVLVRRQRHGSVRRTWQVEVLVCTALWCGGRLGLGRRRDAAGRGMGRRCAGRRCVGLCAGRRLDKDIG